MNGKRYLKIIWILGLLAFATYSHSQELITNGSFEDWSNGVPTGWLKESGVNLSQATNPVYHGNYSIALQATGTANAGVYQDVSVTPGVSYTFKVALFAVNGTGTKGVGFLISWFTSGNSFISSTDVKYANVLNSWVVDSIVADAPPDAAYARLRIRCYADNVLGGYADKASFYRTDSPPQGTPPSFTSIVRNPEYPEPNQPFNVVATVSDPDNDIVACSLYYSLNFGSFQGIGPDSSRNNSYYFGIPGQNSGFFVRYYLLAKDQYHTVFSDTFGFQVGGFSFSVYFENDNLVERLGEFIHGATYSLDCCYYEIFNSTIVDSLIAAKGRGVRIRIITDSTYYNEAGVQRLISNGIPVIHEGVGANSTDHIMHNKFIVRDFGDSDPSNDFVWTGSFNAGDYLHVDNVVTIRSTELADAYTKEFNQMWGSSSISPDTLASRTGTRKSDVLSKHIFISGSDTIWLYFSPQDNPIQYVCNFAAKARSSISYLIYSFTRYDLRDTLISLHNRGISVRGVHEDNAGINPVFSDLQNAGIEVYWANISSPYNLLHAKVMIVDTAYVITGSMNWSNNGTGDNDENLLIIRNSSVARLYWEWFKAHFIEAGGYLGVKDAGTGEGTVTKTILFYDDVKFPVGNLVIFDASGREVKKVGSEKYWDGKDSQGRLVKPGIYFVRDEKGNLTGRLIKIK
uniref:phospholipase D n=1 Tax=candidate division WOR-3 bacterium TaxID=2052148 RepID=A0A7V3KMM0_UNCW3